MWKVFLRDAVKGVEVSVESVLVFWLQVFNECRNDLNYD